MINLAEFFNDLNFAQQVELLSGHGEYINGEWSQYYDPVPRTMIVQPTTPDDLQMLEEGERYLPSKMIHSLEPIKTGDVVNYQSNKWRIRAMSDWNEYGYYYGIAIRRGGTEGSDSKGFEVP